jgi:hypothetical protein
MRQRWHAGRLAPIVVFPKFLTVDELVTNLTLLRMATCVRTIAWFGL